MAFRHPGQRASAPSCSMRAAAVPQCGQKRVPSNIRAKHFGQLIVASRALQYGQRVAWGSAEAPQFGQCSKEASVIARQE
jgi:hypothetical protein